MSILRFAALTAMLLGSTALHVPSLRADVGHAQTTTVQSETGEDAFASIQAALNAARDPWGEGGAILPLAEAQSLIALDEAILMIAPSDRGTYIVLLRRDNVRWYRADVSDEQLRGAGVRLLEQIEPIGDYSDTSTPHRGPDRAIHRTSSFSSFDRMTAWNVYSRLLKPIEAHLEGAARVTIIAAGPAQSIPFAALVTEPPQGEDNDPTALRATSWLGDRHVFVSVPSLSQWRSLRTSPPKAREQFYIGFGDPVPSSLRGRPLHRLPGTRDEIGRVASLFPADRQRIWLDKDASETTAKSGSLSEATILHFATIGVPARSVPDFDLPALALTPSAAEDGWLTSDEIANLQLSADLVIANGCSTSGGMAEAFLSAGARSGLAVAGTVSDEVATEFVAAMMTAAMGETSGDYVRAFQLARQQLRAHPDARFAHPSAWAQFGLFGDP